MGMTKLRESARDQECLIKIPGVCNGDPATTVLCHLNGGGMGRKQPDLFGAFGCSKCHAWVDGGFVHDRNCMGTDQAKRYHLEGVIRTQQWWIDNGYLEV